MLIVIDIGNTHTVLGVYSSQRIQALSRFQTTLHRTEDEWGLLLTQWLHEAGVERNEISGVAIANVVPPLNTVFQRTIQRYLYRTPFFIEPGIRTGLPICVDDPRTVGADRIANAVAVRKLYRTPAVIVDLGTATTFDCLSRQGEYVGGIIAPGIEISAEALFAKAARLPKVDIQPPSSVIGKNTVESMQSGLFYGYLGLIDTIAHRLKRVLGEETFFVCTGGLGHIFTDHSPFLSLYVPDLTLLGIAFLYELNYTNIQS